MTFKKASLIALTASLARASVTLAQDAQDAAEARATEFRAMTGPAQESVPGGMLMIAAYAAIWVFVFVYVWRIAQAGAGVRAELAALERKVSALEGRKDA